MAPSMLDRLSRSLATYGASLVFFFLVVTGALKPVVTRLTLSWGCCAKRRFALRRQGCNSILPLVEWMHFVSRLLDASPESLTMLQSERASLYLICVRVDYS
jgi:hypothetical protein